VETVENKPGVCSLNLTDISQSKYATKITNFHDRQAIYRNRNGIIFSVLRQQGIEGHFSSTIISFKIQEFGLDEIL
jgi:hypothetical protein